MRARARQTQPRRWSATSDRVASACPVVPITSVPAAVAPVASRKRRRSIVTLALAVVDGCVRRVRSTRCCARAAPAGMRARRRRGNQPAGKARCHGPPRRRPPAALRCIGAHQPERCRAGDRQPPEARRRRRRGRPRRRRAPHLFLSASATLSFVPNQSIASFLIELGTLSMTRSPTSSTGDWRRSLAAVVDSATGHTGGGGHQACNAPHAQRLPAAQVSIHAACSERHQMWIVEIRKSAGA